MKLFKKIKRRNRKIKYNEDNYVKSNYIVDGKAVIPVDLERIDDLFMKHDYKKCEISDDVCKYIEEIAYMIPISVDIVIELHCPKVDDLLREKIIMIIKNNYAMDIDDTDYEINNINFKSFVFGIIGIILLIIYLLTERLIGAVLSNFICVVWWVALWEMVELQTIDKSDLKWKRLNYQQLYDSDITFVFDK